MKMFHLMREAAKRKKRSYKQLANSIGVSKGTITRYMNGQIDLRSELVLRLMLVLGYDAYYGFFKASVSDPENPVSMLDIESRYHRRTYKVVQKENAHGDGDITTEATAMEASEGSPGEGA